MIRFFIPGDPVPKQSTRVVLKDSKKAHAYTDPRMRDWEITAGFYATRYCDEKITGPVKVKLTFVLHDKRKKDLDNLSKGVLDGIKGIAFGDDSDVVDIHLIKLFDKSIEPGVKVEVRSAEI